MTAPLKFGFIPSEGPRRFEGALEEVRHAEELGFDSVWIQERHLVADNFWSSPLMAASG
ncbi:MAG: LLM class flavin-dependent oxidoreductase, partial [Parcubacteria group bacterium]|nr:LLM class flavin-dependent oxidoreductase [Parcubacteria group bacterium]